MDNTDSYNMFVALHKAQLKSSGVPQIFWRALYKKIHDNILDAGKVFQLAKIEYENEEKHAIDPTWKLIVSAEKGISAQDCQNIYLIDHAWTYDTKYIQQRLFSAPPLVERMCLLMGLSIEVDYLEQVKNVITEMWRYNQSYSANFGQIENRMPIWYIMDEVGCAINHSNEPNFRAVPFMHRINGLIYTILFPIKDVAVGEEITRDFVEGLTNDPETRRALLLPWVHSSFQDESFEQIEPDENYFLTGQDPESLPEILDEIKIDTNRKVKVYSQYSYVKKYLTDPAFEITDNEEEADILWIVTHYKKYKELIVSSPHVFINQFPYENVLTIKDLLAITCRRKAMNKLYDLDTLETYPEWLPTTYNLSTELVQFVAYFTQRSNKNLDNYWICKPWNLARGLDIHITKNLYHILRMPSTGPKIAQKYVQHPVLYNRPDIDQVKFDIRYIVLLKSVKPLRAYAYANFFLRFANLSFKLDDFDIYEQHFTVMNYGEANRLFHVKCDDFIANWESQYPDYPWKTYVEPKILFVLRQIFEAAVAQPPPKGIAESPQSRAVYAADLMLEWRCSEMQPKLLEINFAPDCERACKYYPDFYNDIFKCLFLDIENPEVFHVLNAAQE
ncbi:hypothetical protein PUN28_008343 [Cardiocondyla obscurior]|uniref:Tubulin--tyrosine ligase-like protein 12 SET-like domain-containing protein n=2 Tax=Cardiocondyla obscurior TaxID=286306 RepID=A0AAW2G0A8_9HYME